MQGLRRSPRGLKRGVPPDDGATFGPVFPHCSCSCACRVTAHCFVVLLHVPAVFTHRSSLCFVMCPPSSLIVLCCASSCARRLHSLCFVVLRYVPAVFTHRASCFVMCPPSSLIVLSCFVMCPLSSLIVLRCASSCARLGHTSYFVVLHRAS